MKIFGKNVRGKEKKQLLGQLLAVVMSGVFATLIGVAAYAWFAKNETVGHTGMQVVAQTDAADILVERATEYDSGYDGIVGSGGLKEKLAAAGYSLSATGTSTASQIAYELVNEYTYETKKYLMPGAYGKMTFYLRPTNGNDGIVQFILSVGGYVNGYDGDDPVINAVTSDAILGLLKGHVLFFTERTGATYEEFRYDGLITGGSFVYDMGAHEKCNEVGKTDCYKVVLYWEWPITYYDITDNISTTSPATVKKYPVGTAAYIENNPSYFFPLDVTDASEEEKSDAYNDGDQMIGDGMDYVVVYMRME